MTALMVAKGSGSRIGCEMGISHSLIAIFGCTGSDGRPWRIVPDEKSLQSVAKRRDGCTMVSFLKAKRKFRLMRPIWLVLALTLSLLASLPSFPQSANSSQPEGTISGTVLDSNGQPFKGVRVCTYMRDAPAGSKESRGDCPATSDEAGQFRIDHVAMGSTT